MSSKLRTYIIYVQIRPVFCTLPMLHMYICRLEKALQEKDLELAETKKRYQTVLAQNEGLRRRYICTCSVCMMYVHKCIHSNICMYVNVFANSHPEN